MTFLQELKGDYKLISEAFKEAKECGDRKLMLSLSEDLIRIADQMETQH